MVTVFKNTHPNEHYVSRHSKTRVKLTFFFRRRPSKTECPRQSPTPIGLSGVYQSPHFEIRRPDLPATNDGRKRSLGRGKGGGQLKHPTQAREISTRLWAKARRFFSNVLDDLITSILFVRMSFTILSVSYTHLTLPTTPYV